MSRGQFCMLVFVVAIAGVFGGYLAQRTSWGARQAYAGIQPAMPEPGKETVVAHRLIVVDGEGSPVVRVSQEGIVMSRPGAEVKLGIVGGEQRQPWFALRRAGGELRAHIGPEGNAELSVQRSVGPGVTCLASDSNAMLSVWSGQGAEGVKLHRGTNSGSIVIEEPDGQGSTSLSRGDDGSSALRVSDGQGHVRARVELPAEGDPHIALRDEEEITFWSAP